MDKNDSNSPEVRSVGYTALIRRFKLEVIPNWHESYVATRGTHRIHTTGNIVRETYISGYWPGDTLGDHLEFALKYDGTNLAILDRIFGAADKNEFISFVKSKPMGKYVRRLWYLYELLTGNRLPLDDLKQGNYIDLLKPKQYYTNPTARRINRQRINDNLLGDSRFCPTVRRTDALLRFDEGDLKQRCHKIVAAYPKELLRRALSYLYLKETKSSFEIEHIKPDANRTERFIALLQLAEREDFCNKEHLIELQNRIVDPRFAESDYRTSQNYVGETVVFQHGRVHYIAPKPGDLPALMDGLIALHRKLAATAFSSIIRAAVVAYGFVFLHPFEDGNGRIHRFLIHNILALGGFRRDEGVILPISATMLKNPADYDSSLEALSRPLMELVEYSLDDEGRMAVQNDTAVWYRYIDMTPQVEALFAFIEKTIEAELACELAFLANYDRTKAAVLDIVDMPDRQVELFIRFCLQNNGRLSANKRKSHFNFLTDDEVAMMEQAFREGYGVTGHTPATSTQDA